MRGLLSLLVVVVLGGGCAPGSQSERAAGEGAKYGAVGGAVAGAVSALIFGGNPLQGAAAGAVTGAASGAAMGAMAGAQADAAAEKSLANDPKVAQLRQRVGDANYAAVLQLAQCQHRGAIATAQEAVSTTQNPQHKTAGLFIQALAAEEAGDRALAGSLYPKIAELDPSRGSSEKLRADTLEGVIKLQAGRRQHGLPACQRMG